MLSLFKSPTALISGLTSPPILGSISPNENDRYWGKSVWTIEWFFSVKFSEYSIDDEFFIIPFSHNPFMALFGLLYGDWLVVFEDKLLQEKLPPLIVTWA